MQREISVDGSVNLRDFLDLRVALICDLRRPENASGDRLERTLFMNELLRSSIAAKTPGVLAPRALRAV